MNAASVQSTLGNTLYSKLRTYLRAYPQWRFSPPRLQVARHLQKFGSEYGGYFVDATLVDSASVVYSLGIGHDISFDLELIAHTGAHVFAFDPTPEVASWLRSQDLPPHFHFRPVGIAGRDGEEAFYRPPRNDWISHSLVRANQYSSQSVVLPVVRLSEAMRLQGHRCIDLLKMDIEGGEYTVIEEIVRGRIPITQLLVEFHHRLSGIGTQRTREALALLESYGMKISYVCPRKEVFTLVRALGADRPPQLPWR